MIFNETLNVSSVDQVDWFQQKPRSSSIQLVQAPAWRPGKALKFTLRKGDAYGGAGGLPRAEVCCPGTPDIYLQYGKTYTITTSYYLPFNYVIDYKQEELSFQVHHDCGTGSPPLGQFFSGGRIYWRVRASAQLNYCGDLYSTAHPGDDDWYDAGPISNVLGRWVDLEVIYRPAWDASGLLVIKMNGRTVVNRVGRNTYAIPQSAGYLKEGIYKWAWNTQPSDATLREVYYGPTKIIVQSM